MATGGRLRDSDVPDIYSCAVCTEHLQDRNPRFLFCHHSFCQQCLQKLTNNGQVSCPICRAVTAVPNNDVTKLTLNFQLLQMMDHLKKERQSIFSSPKCLLCSKKTASYKCRECKQFFCKHCQRNHNKMKIFKSHLILELCKEHMEPITHVCMQCVQALCVKCIVLDHEDHEDQVEEYNEGMEQLKSELDKMNIKLQEKTNRIQERQQYIYIQENDALKKVMELQKKRDVLIEQIEEIDNELVNENAILKNLNGDFKMYSDLSDQCVITSKSMNELLESPYEKILQGFLKQEKFIEQLLHDTDKLQNENTQLSNEDVECITKPLLKIGFSNLEEFKIENPINIKTVESDLFVYSDCETNRFLVFDNTGTVKRSFEGLKKNGSVRCVDVYKNCLYLAQQKQIMCITNFNTRKETKLIYVPKIKEVYGMAVTTDNILICTDSNAGKVYEYNTEDNSTRMVLQGLEHPSYIRVDHTPQGTRYILSLYGSVEIYDEFWQLLTTIVQDIHKPWDTAPCPGGFLLTDHLRNKIKLYSYTGDLVRNVLTEDDGLNGPICLTLNPPYVWVAESFLSIGNSGLKFNGKIKCFKFLK